MNEKAVSDKKKKIKKIEKIDVEKDRSSFLFYGLIACLLLGTIGGVGYFAANRQTNINVAPEVSDHWHFAYSIYDCGNLQPAATDDNDPLGIHTHGSGVVHVHPFQPRSSGSNAQLSVYFDAIGAEITDTSYTPGPSEFGEAITEEAGCDGQPAELKLAYWSDAYDDDAEPEKVIEEDLGEFAFTEPGGMVSLALVPEGEEVPRPPQSRIICQAVNDGVDYENALLLQGSCPSPNDTSETEVVAAADVPIDPAAEADDVTSEGEGDDAETNEDDVEAGTDDVTSEGEGDDAETNEDDVEAGTDDVTSASTGQ